jgi:hypothetical protein
MNNEERKKLIAELRDPSIFYVTGTCLAAAEEIERLAKELKDERRKPKLRFRQEEPRLMTKVTAAKRLEAIGLNDATIAALLKELKENAMTWQYREPNGEWQMFSAPALPTVKRQKMGSPIFDSTFGTGRFKDEKFTDPPRPAQSDAEPVAWPTDEQIEIACEAFRAKCSETHAQSFKPHAHLMKAALQAVAPPRPDASAGLIEAAEFTDQLFSLSFDRCEIDTCEIMELGEKLGLLERVAYNPKVHEGEIDADEGDEIFVRSAKGKAIRARAADRSGK